MAKPIHGPRFAWTGPNPNTWPTIKEAAGYAVGEEIPAEDYNGMWHNHGEWLESFRGESALTTQGLRDGELVYFAPATSRNRGVDTPVTVIPDDTGVAGIAIDGVYCYFVGVDVATSDVTLYKIDDTGTVLTSVALPQTPEAGSLVYGDGFVGYRDSSAGVVLHDAQTLAVVHTFSSLTSITTLAVAHDRIYVVEMDTIYAVDLTGTQIWSGPTGVNGTSWADLFVSGGVVYAQIGESFIECDAATGATIFNVNGAAGARPAGMHMAALGDRQLISSSYDNPNSMFRVKHIVESTQQPSTLYGAISVDQRTVYVQIPAAATILGFALDNAGVPMVSVLNFLEISTHSPWFRTDGRRLWLLEASGTPGSLPATLRLIDLAPPAGVWQYFERTSDSPNNLHFASI